MKMDGLSEEDTRRLITREKCRTCIKQNSGATVELGKWRKHVETHLVFLFFLFRLFHTTDTLTRRIPKFCVLETWTPTLGRFCLFLRNGQNFSSCHSLLRTEHVLVHAYVDTYFYTVERPFNKSTLPWQNHLPSSSYLSRILERRWWSPLG